MAALATAAAAAPAGTAASTSAATVPYFIGANKYVKKYDSTATALAATTTEVIKSIPTTGFLSGCRLEVRSASGVGGTATADNPWDVFQSITLENVDGAQIQYPMGGYAHYLGIVFFRPWLSNPASRDDFVQGVNPAFSLPILPEIKHTAGVLANTDSRSQYRLKYTLNTIANTISGSNTTPPTVTVTQYAEIWAQPDSADLHGNRIQPLPPGLAIQTLRRHQTLTLNAAGSNNILQLTNMGNELRGFVMVVRDSNSARQDYLTDPINWNMDNRSLGVFAPNEVFNRMQDFYSDYGSGSYSRPTGVYVFPRFFDSGRMFGEAWMNTNNATYLAWESSTLSTGTNLPGTVEIITDEVIPVQAVPGDLESI